MKPKIEELSLADAVTHLLEECRMILPGLQALLGFQLIAAGAFVMAPAAYHRQTHLRQASERFLVLGSRLLLIGLIPLMLGIALDFYLIARVILGRPALSALLAALLTSVFAGLWIAWPRLAK